MSSALLLPITAGRNALWARQLSRHPYLVERTDDHPTHYYTDFDFPYSTASVIVFTLMTPLHISQLANTISIPSSTRDHTLSQYRSKIRVKYGSEIIVNERLSIDFTVRVVSSSRLRIPTTFIVL